MTQKKKGKVIQMLSPENYIRQKARTLPIHECWVNIGWEEDGIAHIIVARQHVNHNSTVGVYLIDLKCLGVKDTESFFNMSPAEYRGLLDNIRDGFEIEHIDYALAHNIVFAGLEYAEEYGFKPHKDFALSQFILEEDTDAIELMEIECGHKGQPLYLKGPLDSESRARQIIAQLEKTAGPGNYTFIDGDWDEFEEDEFDEDEFDEDEFDEDEFDEDEFDEDEIFSIDKSVIHKRKNKSNATFQFKIQLKEVSKPPVWRRVAVPDNYTFFEFHAIIQVAFGWFNEHMFQFSPQGYGSFPQVKLKIDDDLGDREFARGKTYDAEKTPLSMIFNKEQQKYTYIYDFGDDWKHEIILEKISNEHIMYPQLLAGTGMCPPEDCGGAWGYENLKMILADPKHPEYEEMRHWYLSEEDEIFNPSEFDLEDHRILLARMFS